MILENLVVRHNKFGDGSVKSFDGKYFTVAFASGDRVFVYPDAFEKFLTVADESVKEKIVSDLALSHAKKEAIRSAKAAENLRSMTHGIVIPGKENLPEQKPEDGYSNELEEL